MSDSDALTPDRIETAEDEKAEDGGGVPAKSSPAAKFPELSESIKSRAEEAERENTRRSYRYGWEHFTAFCEDRDATPLPAQPGTVAVFIEDMARDGYALPTIDTRLAAIKNWHEKAGEEPPTEFRAVRKARENIRKTTEKDREPNRKEPVLMEHLQEMTFDTAELSGLRDRALLYVGFAGGFRRSELVGLHAQDVRDVEGGAIYRIRDPKTSADPQTLQIPDAVPALDPPPNDALREWLNAAGIESGPLFRMVDRWGNVRDGALSGQSVYETVRERMDALGHDPADYGAHSLRAGFATQAYMDGIGEHEAAAQTRHASLETLREYQRTHVVMEDHPLSRMGTAEG